MRVHLTSRSLRYGKSSVIRPAGWPIPKIFASIIPVVRVHPGTFVMGNDRDATDASPGWNDITEDASGALLLYRHTKKTTARTSNGMKTYRSLILKSIAFTELFCMDRCRVIIAKTSAIRECGFLCTIKSAGCSIL